MKLTVEQRFQKLQESINLINAYRAYKEVLPDSEVKASVINFIDSQITKINNDNKPKKAKRINLAAGIKSPLAIKLEKLEEVKI